MLWNTKTVTFVAYFQPTTRIYSIMCKLLSGMLNYYIYAVIHFSTKRYIILNFIVSIPVCSVE